MQPKVPLAPPVTQKKDLAFTISLIQIILIAVSQFSVRTAGSESTYQGAQLGFGGVLISLLATLFGPISLVVFIVVSTRRNLYKKPTGRFILSVIFQLVNLVYMGYGVVIILQLFSWNS